ncbi:MAG: DUF559 domain-containing protein [Actinomycetia bacterium]|nr:DUF559 domain-containing protein [Actinomycetes bacterium]
MSREASGDPPAVSDRARWSIGPDLIPVLCGEEDRVEWADGSDLLLTMNPDEVLVGGWPTLVVERKGVRRLAPLLVMEFEIETGSPVGLLAAEDSGYLNPAIVNDDYFDADACVSARELIQHRLAGAGVGGLDGVIDEVLDVLGLSGTLAAFKPRRRALRVGANDVSIVVRAERSLMTKALLEELETLESRRDWHHTAAGLLLGVPPAPPVPSTGPLASPLLLNDAQEQAVLGTRAEPLTVVTGPPGTGKSQFVVAAVANSWLDGNTVLVASTNNAAVDVAVDRSADLHQILLVRTGNRAHRDKLPEQLGSAMDALPDPRPFEADARGGLARAAATRERLLSLVEQSSGIENELSGLVLRVEQAEATIWPDGRPPAVRAKDVQPRARRLDKAWFFRTWRTRRLLRALAAGPGTGTGDLGGWADDEVRRALIHRELSEIQDELRDLPATMSETQKALIDASREAVVASAATRVDAHPAAVSLIPTIRRGGPGLPRAISQAHQAVLGWATTSLSTKYNFELEAGLYDLAIVDEASQCTIAALLPVAYRAKRIVVVGDPNQLNPVVRLDDRQLDRLARETGHERGDLRHAGLDYGTGSAYLAYEQLVGSGGVRLLDEHYRCHPVIARWFNTAFYGNQLHVLTNTSANGQGRRGLEWIDVGNGETERGRGGGARNPTEAEVVLGIIKDELASGSGIGVVTPFAAQAALIRRLADQRFGSEALASVDFTVGTAHRFQGQEREVIIFSTVLAPNTSPATARWVEQQRNLVNVAASRARRALIVVGHPTAAIELNVPTLASLRKAALEGLPYVSADWMVHSEAEKRLRDALWQVGLSPLVKPVVEGFELDFGFDGPGIRRTNVEVDGRQHVDTRGKQRRRDLTRDAILRAAGWQVLRVPAWRCLSEPDIVSGEIAAAVVDQLTSAEDAEFTRLARLADSGALMTDEQVLRLWNLAHRYRNANPDDDQAQAWADAADQLLLDCGLRPGS